MDGTNGRPYIGDCAIALWRNIKGAKRGGKGMQCPEFLHAFLLLLYKWLAFSVTNSQSGVGISSCFLLLLLYKWLAFVP